MMATASQHPSVPALLSLDGEPFVRQAYRRLLNREADAAGLRSCLAKLRSGTPKERILAELESTPEGRLVARRRGVTALASPAVTQPTMRRLPGSAPFDQQLAEPVPVDQLLAWPDDRTFLRAAYLQVLGRPADEDGLAAGQGYMASGVSRVDMLRVLATSEEGRAAGRAVPGLAELLQREAVSAPPAVAARTLPTPMHVSELLAIASDEAFVRAAYVQMLGREADPAGLAACIQFMTDGASRLGLLRVLGQSEEGAAAGRQLPGLADALKAEETKARAVAAGAVAASQPPAAPSHVDELLDLEQDGAFLLAAYWYLLGRPTDAGGQALYGGLLRKGWSRVLVLRELVNSEEARQRNMGLPGLDPLLKTYARAQQRTWGGWYCRTVLGAESDLPADRRLRALHSRAVGEDS